MKVHGVSHITGHYFPAEQLLVFDWSVLIEFTFGQKFLKESVDEIPGFELP